MPIVRRNTVQSSVNSTIMVMGPLVMLWALYSMIMHVNFSPELEGARRTQTLIGDGLWLLCGMIVYVLGKALTRIPACAYDDRRVDFHISTLGLPLTKLSVPLDRLTRFNRLKPGVYEIFYKSPQATEERIIFKGHLQDAEQFLRDAKFGRRPPSSG